MLKTRAVRHSVRTAGWRTVQRNPAAMSLRRSRGWPVDSRSRGGSDTRDTSSSPAAMRMVLVANGQDRPAAKSTAPIAGPVSLFSVMRPARTRALAIARSSRRTSIGVSVPVVLSTNTSAVASSASVSSTTGTDTRPVTNTPTSTPRAPTRTAFATSTMRRRSSRSESTPAQSPNTSGGAQRSRAASATRSGLAVSDATSSGPAATAIPSLRFVAHDDASNQRNPLPNRAGTTASTTLRTTNTVRRHRSIATGFARPWARHGGAPGQGPNGSGRRSSSRCRVC